jgi:Tol biopolymer transport system component
MNFYNLVPSRDGQKLFVLGIKQRGELVRYDSQARRFEPYLGGISAQFLDYTKDGQWVTYVSYTQGSLWRSRLDGSDRLQLTFPPMMANLPRWSPDGKRIAFSGWAAPGKPAKIYLISAAGGVLEEAIPEDRHTQYDVSWSPDGNLLAWGGVPWEADASHPITIQILDLHTRQISTLPGSRSRFHPAWSPDGRRLSAYHEDWHMVLFYFSTKEWEDLTELPAGYSEWSHDGKYIYFESPPGINRVRITDRKVEQVVSLQEFRPASGWTGLTPKDAPLALRDVGIQEIYALDVDFP